MIHCSLLWPTIPSLVAFGFTNGFILPLVVISAIPFLLSYLPASRPADVQWGPMSLLTRAIARAAPRIQRRVFLLAAIRAAMLFIVVLAASEPFLSPLENLGQVVIVLDCSYPSARNVRGRTFFEQSQKSVLASIASLSPGQQARVILAADPPEFLGSFSSNESALLQKHLAFIEPFDCGIDHDAVVDMIRRTLETTIDGASQIRPRIEIHSPLDRGIWKTWQSGESENSPWQALFTNANVQVVGSHLPCIPYRGMAIEQVYLSPDTREKTGGNTLPLACRIHNFDQATAIVPLEIFCGKYRSQRPLTTAAGMSTEFALSLDNASTEAFCTVKLRSDELDRDDERIVSLHEKPQNTVLICEASDNDALSPLHAALLALGESERARFDNRSVSFSVKGLHMVDLSLVLQENAANVLRYSDNVTQTSRSQVADLIVLCDGVFPSASDRERLSERIASGGVLVVLGGPDILLTRGDPFRQWIASISGIVFNESVPLSAEQITLVGTGYESIDSSILPTPILGPTVSRLIRLEIDSSWQSSHELRELPNTVLQSGLSHTPLLLEQRVGEGKLCVLAIPLTASAAESNSGADNWSDLAAWPAMLPLTDRLMNRWLSRTSPRSPEYFSHAVGEMIQIPLSPGETLPLVVTPSGKSYPMTRSPGGLMAKWGPTRRAGLYRITQFPYSKEPSADDTLLAFTLNCVKDIGSCIEANEFPPEVSRIEFTDDLFLTGWLRPLKALNLSGVLLLLALLLVVLDPLFAHILERSLG